MPNLVTIIFAILVAPSKSLEAPKIHKNRRRFNQRYITNKGRIESTFSDMLNTKLITISVNNQLIGPSSFLASWMWISFCLMSSKYLWVKDKKDVIFGFGKHWSICFELINKEYNRQYESNKSIKKIKVHQVSILLLVPVVMLSSPKMSSSATRPPMLTSIWASSWALVSLQRSFSGSMDT